MPEPTSESAPSNLPPEAASSSSAPTPSVDPALPTSATEVPDQEMREGAGSSSDAAVRLSMKRSSDSPNSESEAKRLHTGHSAMLSCFWMILTSVERSSGVGKFVVGRGRFLSMWVTGTVNLATICVPVA